MNYEQVAVKLRVFSEGRERIKRDRNLSEEGKERALKNLGSEKELFRSESLAALRGEWESTRARYTEILAERERAELEESERWNYPKLEHERNALTSRLSRARNMEELQAIYSQVESSGVPERKRALFELIPQYSGLLGTGLTSGGSLAKRAEQALEELTTTPEMRKASERGGALVKRVQELRAVTLQASDFYYPSYAFGYENEFQSLLNGVSITEKYESESQRFNTTLEIA